MLKHGWEEGQAPEKVLVLGRSGFVASAAVQALEVAGTRVDAIGSEELDLTSTSAAEGLVSRLEGSDVLVFVAAKAPCKDSPSLLQNLRMAEAVHIALQTTSVSQLIYISSDAVYSGESSLIDESAPAAPESMHGMMHSVREMMVAQATDQAVCILRPSLLYGAADPHNGYGPNRFRRLAAAGESIQLFGEGEEMRDHVLIDDVAELIRLCAFHRSAGVLNVVTGVSTSFREVAERTVALFDKPVTVEGTPRQNPVTHVHYNNTAVRNAFPQFRFTDLSAGLLLTHELALSST